MTVDFGIVSPVAYTSCVAVVAAVGTALCIGARTHPGPWAINVARGMGLVLGVDALIWWTVVEVGRGGWDVTTSLPLALCNVAVFVTAAACWWRSPVLVELNYFWALAGALQAIITPDLTAQFPDPEFFQYTGGHAAVVAAALYLVIGLRIPPRPGAVWRTFAISAGYTALVGLVDLVTGADYMFLRSPPPNWTLLRLLGPWPWYIVSASAVALGLFALLNLPFWLIRRRDLRVASRARNWSAIPSGTRKYVGGVGSIQGGGEHANRQRPVHRPRRR